MDIVNKLSSAAKKKALSSLNKLDDKTTISRDANSAARISNRVSSINRIDKYQQILESIAEASSQGEYKLKISDLKIPDALKIINKLTRKKYTVVFLRMSSLSSCILTVIWAGKKLLQRTMAGTSPSDAYRLSELILKECGPEDKDADIKSFEIHGSKTKWSMNNRDKLPFSGLISSIQSQKEVVLRGLRDDIRQRP